jgi:hypothetical protein
MDFIKNLFKGGSSSKSSPSSFAAPAPAFPKPAPIAIPKPTSNANITRFATGTAGTAKAPVIAPAPVSTVMPKPVVTVAPRPAVNPTTPIKAEIINKNTGTYAPPLPPAPNATQSAVNTVVNTPPPVVQTEPVLTKKQSQLKEYIDAVNPQRVADEKAKLQQEANLQAKKETAVKLYGELQAQKRSYENQIEKIRQNPEGKLASALQSELNEFSRQADRNLADKAIIYSVANDDFQGAQQILNAQLEDIDKSFTQKAQAFQLASDYISDDLTESEKQKLQQDFDLLKIDYENEVKSTKDASESLILEAKAQNYQNLLNAGSITIDKIPQDVIAYMDTATYASPEQKASKQMTLNRLDTILDLTTNPLGNAVGPGAQQLAGKVLGFVGIGDYEARRKVVDNLISSITLDVLPSLKGPASDKDVLFIKDAASSLNPNSSEKAFKEQLQIVTDRIARGVLNSTTYTPEEKISVAAKQFKIKDPTATPEQITEMIKIAYPDIISFNQAGNASASKIANAIKTVESQGNYNAVGDAGTSKGAYQFNGNNFNAWSKQYFGKELPFTPANQDLVAEAHIQNLLDKGNTPEQVALIWNGGEPKRKKGYNAKIGLYYDSGAYADKVLAKLNG